MRAILTLNIARIAKLTVNSLAQSPVVRVVCVGFDLNREPIQRFLLHLLLVTRHGIINGAGSRRWLIA
jgi:hypothetical protein